MSTFNPKPLSVFLLDDHDIVRRGLADLMSAKRDITVVGDTDSVRDAARLILRLKPDVMVLDVHLQDGTGVEVCREVRAADPSIHGVLLTAAADEEALVLAMLAGASGYVIKLARSIEIVDAVRKVGAGERLIDSEAAERVLGRLRTELQALQPPLAKHEIEMLAHVLKGRTDTQVAEQMGLAPDHAGNEIAALIAKIVAATPWMTPWT